MFPRTLKKLLIKNIFVLKKKKIFIADFSAKKH